MSSRIHAARFDEALEALAFYVGWHGGWVPFERRREDRTRRFWRDARAPGLPAVVRALDERYSDEIAFGLPQRKRYNGGVSGATILHARIEGSEQLKRARVFKPRPTIVLQEGSSSRRLLIWALEEFVPYYDLVAANKRIAYRLGAKQVDGDPDRLWIPAPGTCLRVGRSRAVPVVVGRLTMDTHSRLDVVGRLKDPPAPVKWWEGATG